MATDWIILLFAFIFSAFFSGMEIAFVSANKLKIEVDKKRGMVTANILSKFIKKPSYFIGTMLVGNNIALVIYGIAVTRVLDPWLIAAFPTVMSSDVILLLSDTIISTVFILIIAEFTPKIIFRSSTNSQLYFFTIPVLIIYWIFYPIVLLFIFIAEMILRLFGMKIQSKQEYNFNIVDIDNYIQSSIAEDSKQEELSHELQMFQNAIDFKSVKLRECIVPRPEIVALDVNDNIDELTDNLVRTGHSKILIYKESVDNVIGYVNAYDLFGCPQRIRDIIRPILVFPETMPARTALQTMLRDHKSIAVVMDEFGGTSGMITTEDIIEEILGEIDDEFDKQQEVEIEQISENEFIISGRLEIDYLNEKHALEFPDSEQYETLAGFIISEHEDIPEKDEIINIGKFSFTILDATKTKIKKVRLVINED